MKKLLYLFLASYLFLGCSGIKVTADYDKTIDFTQFKTFEYFGWVEESDKILSPFDKERIESAFGEEFKSRDIEVVKEGGDLVVALYIVTEKKTEKTATTYNSGGHYGGYGRYYGYGPGWGYGGGYSTTTINEYDYVVGTLVCSVYDKKNEKLIWEGIGTKTVDDNPQTRDKTIPYAVKLIMAQYPVKASPTK